MGWILCIFGYHKWYVYKDGQRVCRHCYKAEEKEILMDTEILDCPHCGHADAVQVCTSFDITECSECCDDKNFAVICRFTVGGCGAQGGYRPTVEGAIEAWNRRS